MVAQSAPRCPPAVPPRRERPPDATPAYLILGRTAVHDPATVVLWRLAHTIHSPLPVRRCSSPLPRRARAVQEVANLGLRLTMVKSMKDLLLFNMYGPGVMGFVENMGDVLLVSA